MDIDRRSTSHVRYPMLINAAGPVTLRKTGLIMPGRLSLSVWQKIGTELATISESSTWWLADWVLYGETAYTGRYRQVIESTGLGYQTLRNYAWVARRFELSRRRDALSFAHHAEVASLEQPEQDYWLRWAEQQQWSRNRLRKEIRSSLAERQGEEQTDSASAGVVTAAERDRGTVTESVSQLTSLHITITAEQLKRCEQLATAQGLSLSGWAIEVLQAALRDVESEELSTACALIAS
ncbi:LmbU family transcriptional regulator [Streptomyces sp. NPDC041068]|uniref:LmbU family transcriptional regulator n=1 Tax=Streptomyces sp. NPDC041068 TaxID=3155130 RepID=UPI0033D8151B